MGWNFLKKGDIVNAVERAQGLKKGEKIKKLCQIKIKSVSKEPLNKITQSDVIKEGFPDFSVDDFVNFFTSHYKIADDVQINRIEFEYV